MALANAAAMGWAGSLEWVVAAWGVATKQAGADLRAARGLPAVVEANEEAVTAWEGTEAVEALAAGKAAVEAERDADKQQYETKIAQLQAQLAARD